MKLPWSSSRCLGVWASPFCCSAGCLLQYSTPSPCHPECACVCVCVEGEGEGQLTTERHDSVSAPPYLITADYPFLILSKLNIFSPCFMTLVEQHSLITMYKPDILYSYSNWRLHKNYVHMKVGYTCLYMGSLPAYRLELALLRGTADLVRVLELVVAHIPHVDLHVIATGNQQRACIICCTLYILYMAA